MLDPEAFSDFLRDHPDLGRQIRDSLGHTPGRRHLGHLTSAVGNLFMSRLVQGLLLELGFPWERQQGEYNEADLRRLADWIEREYAQRGDPVEPAERAALKLMLRLQRTDAPKYRQSWEKLKALAERPQDKPPH